MATLITIAISVAVVREGYFFPRSCWICFRPVTIWQWRIAVGHDGGNCGASIEHIETNVLIKTTRTESPTCPTIMKWVFAFSARYSLQFHGLVRSGQDNVGNTDSGPGEIAASLGVVLAVNDFPGSLSCTWSHYLTSK